MLSLLHTARDPLFAPFHVSSVAYDSSQSFTAQEGQCGRKRTLPEHFSPIALRNRRLAMSAVPDRLELLRRSWTMVAEGYQQQFVPRFAPWTRQTLQLLAERTPPRAGTIAVPACGPGTCALCAAANHRRPLHWAAPTPRCPAALCTPAHTPPSLNCLPAGQELALLAAGFPRHRIVGIDLAEGMVELARQLVARSGLGDRVEVR